METSTGVAGRSMNMSLSKLWEVLKGREAWGAVVHRVTESGHNLAREQQQVPGACSNSGRKEAEEHAWDISGLQQFGKLSHLFPKLGKEYVKAVYCHPAYLTSMQVHHVNCQKR